MPLSCTVSPRTSNLPQLCWYTVQINARVKTSILTLISDGNWLLEDVPIQLMLQCRYVPRVDWFREHCLKARILSGTRITAMNTPWSMVVLKPPLIVMTMGR